MGAAVVELELSADEHLPVSLDLSCSSSPNQSEKKRGEEAVTSWEPSGEARG